MKIVYTKLNDRYYGIVRAAMDTKDIETIPWIPKKFPVFDMLEDLKPEVLFLDLKEVTKVTIEACNEFAEQTKVILFGQGVPQNLIPAVLVAPPNTSQTIKRNIESDKYKTVYLYDSANIVDFFGGKSKEYLACDVGYVFNQKDPELYTKQISFLAEMSRHFKIKVVGNEKLGLPQFLGTLEPKGISSFYKSCKIVIDYKGEQILDIAANGGYSISTIPNKLYPTFTSNALEQVENLLKKEKTRSKVSQKAQQQILEGSTCYHRLQEILRAVNIQKDEIQKRLEEKVLCA